VFYTKNLFLSENINESINFSSKSIKKLILINYKNKFCCKLDAIGDEALTFSWPGKMVKTLMSNYSVWRG